MTARTFALWGSNTGVGKTLVSAGLARTAAAAAIDRLLYLKPVQTGLPNDSDGMLVAKLARGWHRFGEHAAEAANDRTTLPPKHSTASTSCCTLFGWRPAVSPHLAVAREGRAVADHSIIEATQQEMRTFFAHEGSETKSSIVLVETAGGVASPGPSGSLQCDILSPLSLTAVLVADGRLGGISASICAAEVRASLHIRSWQPCEGRPIASCWR